MQRSARPWGIALTVSLLLHVVFLGGVDWRLLQGDAERDSPVVLEARLVAVPPPPVPQAPPAPPRAVSPKPAAPDLSPPQPEQVPPPAEPVVEAAAPTPPHEAPPPDISPTVAAPVPAASATPAPALPPLNALPPRIDLRFDLHYGLASGEQTLVWVNEGGQYTLTSVAAATGLAGVFYRGRFVQMSRGRVTPQGLQPEEFWDQRGEKRSAARFNRDAGLVTLEPASGAPRHFAYPDRMQDVLSLFFQLALVAPPDGAMRFPVFNGKKLRTYAYVVRGEETLDTALGPLRTLRIAQADGEGRFEAWLAIDRHYLPVRVLKSDSDGREMELAIRTMTP